MLFSPNTREEILFKEHFLTSSFENPYFGAESFLCENIELTANHAEMHTQDLPVLPI
jgi:hypothetical protein